MLQNILKKWERFRDLFLATNLCLFYNKISFCFSHPWFFFIWIKIKNLNFGGANLFARGNRPFTPPLGRPLLRYLLMLSYLFRYNLKRSLEGKPPVQESEFDILIEVMKRPQLNLIYRIVLTFKFNGVIMPRRKFTFV